MSGTMVPNTLICKKSMSKQLSVSDSLRRAGGRFSTKMNLSFDALFKEDCSTGFVQVKSLIGHKELVALFGQGLRVQTILICIGAVKEVAFREP